jgi:hypothetical protein
MARTEPARIDIDRLSEAELIDLNHRIVARLKLLRELQAHQAMLDFRMGERVSFEPPGRGRQLGIITRYNRKSVTVITEDGGHWTVAPALLSKASPAPAQAASAADIIDLEPRT